MISHIILPLCVVPLTFILIPDLKMTDNIQIEHDEHSNTGGDGDDGAGGEGGGGGDGGGNQGRGLSINANAKKKKKKKRQKGRASSPTGSDDSQVGLMDGMSGSDGSESDDLDLQRL